MSFSGGAANYYFSTNMVSTNKFKDQIGGKQQFVTQKQQNMMFNGFAFKKKNEKIDWRRIASLDIDRVAKELDFAALQDNIDHITFCNIEAEIDTRLMDPNFIKLFKLSQLTIEYLLQTQEYLTGVIGDSEMNFEGYRVEAEELKKANEKMHKELTELKKENKKRKKLIESQQTMINVNQTNYHRCVYCSKVFLNVSYLQAHLNRRHNQMPMVYGTQTQQPQTQTQPSLIQSTTNTEIEKELDKIKQKLQQTENELQQERTLRLNITKEDMLLKKMEEWKNEQTVKHNNDMNMIKEKFLKEIDELTNKNSQSERTLKDLQNRIGNGKQSNVGWMRDEIDMDKDAYLRQQNELEMLKIKDQNISKQIDELNENWQYKDLKLKEKYKRQIEEKNSIIEELNNKIAKRNKEIENEINKRAKQEITKRQKLENEKVERLSNERLSNERLSNERKHHHSQHQHHSHQHQQLNGDRDISERSQPPPITPRLGVRSPSPPKAVQDINQLRARTPSRQSLTVELILPEYCPKLKEALKYDENILSTYRNKVKNMLISELDDIGIYPDDTGLSSNDYKLKINDLQRFREELVTDYPNFNKIRKTFIEICDEQCKQKLSSSLRSSNGLNNSNSGGNRVTFHKNLITKTKDLDNSNKQLNSSINSINKKPINLYTQQQQQQQQHHQHHHQQQHNIRSDSEETNDEVTISNAMESNDDDTEPTKQNFNLNRNYNNNNNNNNNNTNVNNNRVNALQQQQKRQLNVPQRNNIPQQPSNLSQNLLQPSQQNRPNSRSPYQYSEDDLESVTQIEDKQPKNNGGSGSAGYVSRTAKSMDKELSKIMNKGVKPSANAVPVGFRSGSASPMRQDMNDSYGSVSSIEMTENSKHNKKLQQQASMDNSTNTSIWASVTHGVGNNQNNANNNNNNKNDLERPTTANSILTSNLDSDEFDYIL